MGSEKDGEARASGQRRKREDSGKSESVKTGRRRGRDDVNHRCKRPELPEEEMRVECRRGSDGVESDAGDDENNVLRIKRVQTLYGLSRRRCQQHKAEERTTEEARRGCCSARQTRAHTKE